MLLTAEIALLVALTVKVAAALAVAGTLWYASIRYGGPGRTCARGGYLLLGLAGVAFVASSIFGYSARF